MNKNKHLNKLIDQALKSCIVKDKLDQKKAENFVSQFKKLPPSQAIYCLTRFGKGIQNESKRTTLTINSVMELQKLEKENIVREVKRDFEVENVEVNVNKDIIGGLKVKIGDFIYDFSVKSRIAQIGQMIKGG